LQLDLIFKRIRLIVEGVLRSNAKDEIKVKCVELLIRNGLIGGNPEDLILAAQFQYEFRLDISKHLGFFLDKSELFDEPPDETQFALKDGTRVTGKLDYNG
jgi:hypothetical protein